MTDATDLPAPQEPSEPVSVGGPAQAPPPPPEDGSVAEAAGYAQQSLLPPSTTGDPRVDASLAGLDDLGRLPVHEQVAAFEAIHGALAGALADLDQT